MKRILLFILILLSVLICLLLFLERKDHTKYALNLYEAISEELVKSGISDADIIQQYWREKKRGFFEKWLEITHEISLPKKVSFEKLKTALVKSVERYNPEVVFSRNKNTTTIEFTKKKKIFVRLIFQLIKKLKIAIVIDDLGYNLKNINDFLNLGIKLNFTILPKEKYTMQIAQKLSKLNVPFLMHLPLEPKNIKEQNPGSAALLLNMSEEEIKCKFEENLASLGAKPAGVSNHMGSAFTESAEKMAVLLKCIKKHNLFFLDSHTAKKPVSSKVAKTVGIKCVSNDVFLDIEWSDKEKIKKQFDILLNIAKKHGVAIGIGHIYRKALLEVLKSVIAEYKQKNIEFVYLNEL